MTARTAAAPIDAVASRLGPASRTLRATRFALFVAITAALVNSAEARRGDGADPLPAGATVRIGSEPAGATPLPGVRVLAFSADGRLIAVSGEPEDPSTPRRVVLFDARTGTHLAGLEMPAAQVMSLEFSPDGGRLLATAAEHPQGARVFELPSGRLIRALATGNGHARFVDDGARIAIADRFGAIDVVRIFDVASGEEVRRFAVEVSYRQSISPDCEKLLAVRSLRASTLDVIDLPTGRPRAKLEGSRSTPSEPTFSPDGRTVAAIDGNDILVWELATQTLVHRLSGHSGRVLRLTFSADGRQLASGSADRTARVWEVATGRELHRFEAHESIVSAIEFSGDGKRLATGGLDRALFVWDLDRIRRTFLSRDPPDAAGLVQLWHELGSADAAQAYRTLGTVVMHSGEALADLDRRVEELLAPIRTEQISRLIVELGDASYIVRQRATNALRKLREAARPALIRALRTSDSAEVRERAHRILSESADTARFSPADIRRMLRIIHAAEMVGDQTARRLLGRIAADFPVEEVQREAERTRQALERRPPR